MYVCMFAVLILIGYSHSGVICSRVILLIYIVNKQHPHNFF